MLIITNENSGETDDKTRKNKVFDEEIHILGRDKIIVAVGCWQVSCWQVSCWRTMAAFLGFIWEFQMISTLV
jgi:hypothetical protein